MLLQHDPGFRLAIAYLVCPPRLEEKNRTSQESGIAAELECGRGIVGQTQHAARRSQRRKAAAACDGNPGIGGDRIVHVDEGKLSHRGFDPQAQTISRRASEAASGGQNPLKSASSAGSERTNVAASQICRERIELCLRPA
jgi:hypothetical protein